MLGLMACVAATSPDEIANKLKIQYRGLPVMQFFDAYGPPSSELAMPHGGTMYIWSSGQKVDTTTDRWRKYNAADAATLQPQPSSGPYCELRVYADYDNVMSDLVVAVDTVSSTTPSRCSEIFYSRF